MLLKTTSSVFPDSTPFCRERLEARVLVAVVLFAAAVCFSHLHQGSLMIDSVRYAHIAHIIDKTDNWLHLHDEFKDSEYSNKSPLLLWLVAISLKIFGFSTFSVKLPAVLFVFGGLLAVWHLVAKLYGRRAAFFTLFLLCANRVFVLAIVDLNFEGIVFCGALCCLSSCLNLIRESRELIRNHFIFGLGVFLLLQSKPPYLLFIAIPILIIALQSSDLRKEFSRMLLSKFVLCSAVLGVSWLLLGSSAYLSQAFSNQVYQPLTISHSYLFNLLRWMRAVFLEFAPLSWLGIAALVLALQKRHIYKLRWYSNYERNFYVTWIALSIGVIICADYHSRYLLIPFIGLAIWGGRLAAKLFSTVRSRHLVAFCNCLGVVFFAVFSVLGFKAHAENGAVSLLKRYPLLQNTNTVVCVGGTNNLTSKPTRKRMKMLLELEFNRAYPVVMSQTLGLSSLQPGMHFLAENRCLEDLQQASVHLTVLDRDEHFVLAQLDSALPEATRSGADDRAYSDYH